MVIVIKILKKFDNTGLNLKANSNMQENAFNKIRNWIWNLEFIKFPLSYEWKSKEHTF